MEEKRYAEFPAQLELRTDTDTPRIVGYAAVFDALSEPMMGFREIIRRGAFAKTIQEADVRALFNHDANFVLGRTKSGTLRLSEDETGLRIEIDPPMTQMVRDMVLEPMKRGDIDQMSFGFRVVKDNMIDEEGQNLRELLEVKLFDISPVTFPAYPQTSVALRTIDPGIIERIEKRAKDGSPLDTWDILYLQRAIDWLSSYVTKSEPVHADHSEEPEPDPVVHSHERLRRRLELITRL